MQFATNHLRHFALTTDHGTPPGLAAADSASVVSVASIGHPAVTTKTAPGPNNHRPRTRTSGVAPYALDLTNARLRWQTSIDLAR
jgi:hypothetical protein